LHSLSNNHFNLARFGQIRRFPSREQPVDDFWRNPALARSIPFGQRRGPGFYINNADSRIVRRAQANAMLAQLAANVRGVPDERALAPQIFIGAFAAAPIRAPARHGRKFFIDINVFIRYCPRQRIYTLIVKKKRLRRKGRRSYSPITEERIDPASRLRFNSWLKS